MFINCRHCNALVATDPATDEPPERCPRCAGAMRTTPAVVESADAPVPGSDVVDVVAEALPSNDSTETSVDLPVAPEQAIAEPEPEPESGPETASVPTTDPGAEQAIVAAGPLPARDGAKSAWARAADLLAGLARKPSAIPASRTDPAPMPANDMRDATADADDAADDAAQAPVATATAPGPVAEIDAATQHDPDAPATADAPADHDDASAGRPIIAPEPPIATDVPGTPPADTAPPAAKPAPSFAAGRRDAAAQRAPRQRWLAPAVIAALCASLALQILLADRAQLAADARWRPLLSSLCGVFGCALPPWREPQALVLVSRDVRPHPSRQGVLRATATFRNDARWAQAWPRVVLVLSDVDGRAIGARAFDVRDYLGAQPADAVLSSGQSAMIRLDVVEPAADVVAFSFEFR